MSFVIDPKLHQAFKVAATLEGKEMSEVLIEFIKRYVAQHPSAARLAKKGGRP